MLPITSESVRGITSSGLVNKSDCQVQSLVTTEVFERQRYRSSDTVTGVGGGLRPRYATGYTVHTVSH